MDEGRLEQIKEDLANLEATSRYDTNDFSNDLFTTNQLAHELVEEVETLRGRLQAVCDVLSDADAFNGVVEANAKAKAWDSGMQWAATLLNADELVSSFRKDNPYRVAASTDSGWVPVP